KPILLVAAGVVGAALWVIVPRPFVPVPMWAWAVVGAALVACAIPSVATRMVSLLDRVCRPSRATRAGVAVAIAIVSSVYLVFTAARQDRDFFPKTQDDQSYVLQMRMLSHGRLWMPAHPLGDFFDS